MLGFGSPLFKKKIRVMLYEKNIGWRDLKGTLKYNKDTKEWMLHFAGEKLPAPKNIFDLVWNETVFIVREQPDKYTFLKPKIDFKTGEVTADEYTIPPEEIARAFIRAEERRLRTLGFWEKNLPIITAFFVVIMVGIFIAIIWSTTGESMKTISANFKGAMDVLQNITQTQLEILQKLRGVETLPTIPTPAK
jgi:hypothetical protein